MKFAWYRSLAALGLGWFATGLLLGIFTLLTGTLARTIDLNTLTSAAGIWLIVGIFALLGWLLVILPLTGSAPTRKWLSHPALTEVVWAFAGVSSFILIFLPLSGAVLFQAPAVLLTPAGIGALSGLSYRWLMRKEPRA